jgi:uncharacterized protein (DUF924 family)
LPTESDQRAIRDIIHFWFADATKPRWYDSNQAFDDLCRQRFEELASRAANRELDEWAETAEGALALVILLDQIPRNIYRGTAKAFASDRIAVAITERAIASGADQTLDLEKRKFLYLPYMHSEVLEEQERSVAQAMASGDEKTLHYAREHADIIREFGRFPHRNAILGRQNTVDEETFLAAGAENYGQSLSKDGDGDKT